MRTWGWLEAASQDVLAAHKVEREGPKVRRGELSRADLPAPAGRRPLLLLSRDEAYAHHG